MEASRNGQAETTQGSQYPTQCNAQNKILLCDFFSTQDTHSEFLLHKNGEKNVFQLKYILP